MAHDLLSPSSAHCWMKCPGAPALAAEITDADDSSVYAEEGTLAHEQAERAANSWFENIPYYPSTDDAEMIRHAQGWAKMLGSYVNRQGLAFWAAERKLAIGVVTGRTGATGTADFVAIDKNGLLTIADFKYGMGVEVQAERNPQLSIYALAAIAEFDVFQPITGVRLIIYQPRISEREKVYEWDMGALRRFGVSVAQCAERATSLIGKPDIAASYLNPGEDQCRFCKAKATCPALRAKTKEVIAADFDILPVETKPELPVPTTEEQLSRALPWLETIEKWCDAVRARALSHLMGGGAVPGYKIVAGRKGARKWVPGAEEEIDRMRIRRDVLYTKTLITPTQAERAVKEGHIGPRQWRAISKLFTQSEGKPALAPESDKRPAITVSLKDEFETLEENK